MEKNPIAKAIAEKLERIAQTQKAIASIEYAAGELAVLAKIVRSKYTESVYVSGWSDQVTVSAVIRKLPGLKKGTVPRIIERLSEWAEKHEWEAEWSNNDYADYLNRTYRVALKKAGQPYMQVTLDCYVVSDSPTCRRIVVGEETRIVPKYEMRCD